MDLAITTTFDDHWSIVVPLGFFIALPFATVLLWLAIRYNSRKLFWWSVFAPLAISALLFIGWEQFGWHTQYSCTEFTRHHRLCGRVIALSHHPHRNHLPDGVTWFDFSRPWTENRSARLDYVVSMSDSNGDGRWDTWWWPIPNRGEHEKNMLFEADTDLDGFPDYSKIIVYGEPWGYQQVIELRGF